jgi:hypothetical protein
LRGLIRAGRWEVDKHGEGVAALFAMRIAGLSLELIVEVRQWLATEQPDSKEVERWLGLLEAEGAPPPKKPVGSVVEMRRVKRWSA